MTLKEELFNKKTVSVLANLIKDVYSAFNAESFINDCTQSFAELELKERMSHVRKTLYFYMPEDYITTVNILSKALSNRQQSRFIFGSVLEYIEVYGCTDEFVDYSLQKLGELSASLSSEFAVRPFFNTYPDKTLEMCNKWSKSEDYHIRRLASEGSRPSLPWAMKINVDYKQASLPLDNLYYDEERYVTRSVANHLNDISKIDPDFILEKLHHWKTEGKQNQKEMNYIITHSLRTLIKKGHSNTLQFLGYDLNPNIEVSDMIIDNNVINIGENLNYSFSIKSNEDTKLMIDYTIYYPSNTKRMNKKTFKLKQISLKANETYHHSGKKAFKDMSTRKMKVGTHQIDIQINGKVYIKNEFELIKK